jgi:hypothetical protein
VDPHERRSDLDVNTLAVQGFEPARGGDRAGELIRSPLSGSVFYAESVPAPVADRLTDRLFEMLAAESPYELISPGQVRGAYASVIRSDPRVTKTPLEIIQAVGQRLNADAVLAGHVYRWREREGTDYGVYRAASVAFEVTFIRPEDGAVLWRWKYDKTQKSFFENALDLSTFVKSKGRWLKVEDLARLGLQDMMEVLPVEKPELEQIERDDYSGY